MKHLTILALALLAASAVHAEDVRFGVQATVSQPSGDFGNKDWMDSKLGLGVGLQAVIHLEGGAAIVPRIDYMTYKNDRTIGAWINEDAKINILSAGADFQYYFSGKVSQGFYLLGGLGYARGDFNTSYSSNTVTMNVNGTKGALYLQGGVGIHFTPNFGLEARYQSIKFSDVETTFLGITARQDVSCPSLQASVVFRF